MLKRAGPCHLCHLSKGVAEACLRQGSDLSRSAAGVLPGSVHTYREAVSAWSPGSGGDGAGSESPPISCIFCSLSPFTQSASAQDVLSAWGGHFAFYCPSKSSPPFKVQLKYHLLQRTCPDYHPQLLIQEEVMTPSSGFAWCPVSLSLFATTEANYMSS